MTIYIGGSDFVQNSSMYSYMMTVLWFLLYGGVTVEEIGIDVNSGGTWGLKRYTKLSGR